MVSYCVMCNVFIRWSPNQILDEFLDISALVRKGKAVYDSGVTSASADSFPFTLIVHNPAESVVVVFARIKTNPKKKVSIT